MTCSVCSQLFIDPVVARCSHAFCRVCLEKCLRKATSSCPICNSPPLLYYKVLSDVSFHKDESMKRHPAPMFYHRCCQIENIVWLVLESMGPEELRIFKSREKDHHQYLMDLGIDPTKNYGLYEEQQKNYNSELEILSSDGPFRKTRSNYEEYCDLSDNSEDSNRYKPKKKSKKNLLFCDYCAETNHLYADCPHRNQEGDDDDNDEEEEDD